MIIFVQTSDSVLFFFIFIVCMGSRDAASLLHALELSAEAYCRKPSSLHQSETLFSHATNTNTTAFWLFELRLKRNYLTDIIIQ